VENQINLIPKTINFKRALSTALAVIIACFTLCTFAQNDSIIKRNVDLSCSYINLGVGSADGFLFGFGGNLIFSNNWGVSLSYCGNIMKAEEQPPDYSAGLSQLFEWHDLGIDRFNAVSARLVKEFPIAINVIRFGVEGGVSYISYKRAHFIPIPHPAWLGSNYDVTYSINPGIGLSLRAKVEFPVTKYAGFELALISNMNGYYSFMGTEIHLTFGKVRDSNLPDTKY
jgi:hypothetical protein